jgi:hypothetical protein
MIKQTSLTRLTIDRAKANIEINNYPGQRSFKPARIRELCEKLQDGRFRTAHIATATLNGNRWLMNGQHQSVAVIKTGIEPECFLEDFACESAEQVAQLFAQFDEGNVRSARDMSKAFTIAIGATWSERTASVCATALSFLKFGEAYASLATKDVRAGLLSEHRKDVDWASVAIFPGKHPWLHLTGTVAAAISSYRVAGEDATLFWESVREGDKLAKGDSAFTLREFLISRYTKKHQAGKGSRTVARELYCKSIYAWNAYRRNEPLGFLKFLPSVPNPEAI